MHTGKLVYSLKEATSKFVFWVRPCRIRAPPHSIFWLAVHLCPTAAWVSGWWTLLGCHAGALHLLVKVPLHHRMCTPQPRPLMQSSPNSLGISMSPLPQPLLPLAATEPGKAVLPRPAVSSRPLTPLLLPSFITACAAAPHPHPHSWQKSCAVCSFKLQVLCLSFIHTVHHKPHC